MISPTRKMYDINISLNQIPVSYIILILVFSILIKCFKHTRYHLYWCHVLMTNVCHILLLHKFVIYIEHYIECTLSHQVYCLINSYMRQQVTYVMLCDLLNVYLESKSINFPLAYLMVMLIKGYNSDQGCYHATK